MSVYNPITIHITRDDGESLIINDTTEVWGIVSIMGLEFPEPEVFTSAKGLGDGVFITGRRLNGRTIEIHLRPRVRYLQELMTQRRRMMQFFEPSHSFSLLFFVYDTGSGADSATGRGRLPDTVLLAASYPVIQAEGAKEDLVLQFLAENPYFEYPTDSLEVYTTVLGDLTTTEFEYAGEGDAIPFVISGEILTAPDPADQIYLNYRKAGATTTEAFLFTKSSGNFAVGDTFELNTGNATFSVNGESSPIATSQVARIADHWNIGPGTNRFGGGSGGMTARLRLTYRARSYSL